MIFSYDGHTDQPPIAARRSCMRICGREETTADPLRRLGAAEIGIADAGIVLQRAGGAGENDLAGLEHIGLVRDLECEAGVCSTMKTETPSWLMVRISSSTRST